MVGRVIFKNYETGSYEYMRVTMYEGGAYLDMDKATEFSSCLVSLEKRSFDYDYFSSDKAPVMSIAQLNKLCTLAMEFLKKNTDVTMVDFCMINGTTTLRKSSFKSGLYEPVDFSAVANYKRYDLYKLCIGLDEESYLCRSVLCSVLNYCMHRLYNTDDKLFGLSGKGLYINAALFVFDRFSMKQLDVAKDMKKLIVKKISRRFCPHLVRSISVPTEIVIQRSFSPHVRLISLWRKLREDTYLHLCKKLSHSRYRGVTFALYSLRDEQIRNLVRDFAEELKDYVSNYKFYFEAPSHIDYLDLEDALALSAHIDLAEKIAKRAAKRSANMKLIEKIPSPDYYDSRGRAYNI